ncbi:MAG TPA: serine hydrolase, partial [Burkholderiaceae bacterium]
MSEHIENSGGAEAPHATIANWRTRPYSKWAFCNISDILPTASIQNDADRISRLGHAAEALDDFKLQLKSGEPLNLPQFLQRTQTDGFLIMVDGVIVHENYRGMLTPPTRHILMSATKSVAGLLCGILRDKGVLDVEAPVSEYVREIAATAYAGATVRNLLDMRANPLFEEAEFKAYVTAANWDPVAAGARPSGLHEFYASLPHKSGSHGGPFRYISANTDLLGWVMERAAGRPLSALMQDLLWRPMDAEQTAYLTLDRNGAPRTTGGLCTTLRDFARIGQLLMEQESHSLISPSWIDDIADGGDHAAWASGEFAAAFQGAKMRYRNCWYVMDAQSDRQPQTLFAMGIHGQNLFVDRANRMVIAKFSSQAQALDVMAITLTQMA